MSGILPFSRDAFAAPNELTADVSFTVWGRARPAGSKRVYGKYAVADNQYVESWMQEVRSAGAKHFGKNRELLTGPLELTVLFLFARPLKHYGTGRNADKLKASAPKEYVNTPDLSKLLRAVEDALSTIVWKDDRQIVRYGRGTAKEWAPDGRECAIITVREL